MFTVRGNHYCIYRTAKLYQRPQSSSPRLVRKWFSFICSVSHWRLLIAIAMAEIKPASQTAKHAKYRLAGFPLLRQRSSLLPSTTPAARQRAKMLPFSCAGSTRTLDNFADHVNNGYVKCPYTCLVLISLLLIVFCASHILSTALTLLKASNSLMVQDSVASLYLLIHL